MPDHNIQDPILVVIRRGRNDRGFVVSPIDDVQNPAMCLDPAELGKVVVEMLDDPNQPRVNLKDLLNAVEDEEGEAKSPSGNGVSEDDNSEGDEEEEGEGGIFDGVKDSEEPADTLLINILSAALQKGRDMSSRSGKRRRGRSHRRK